MRCFRNIALFCLLQQYFYVKILNSVFKKNLIKILGFKEKKMKRKIIRSIGLLMSLFAVGFTLVSCGDSEVDNTNTNTNNTNNTSMNNNNNNSNTNNNNTNNTSTKTIITIQTQIITILIILIQRQILKRLIPLLGKMQMVMYQKQILM